MGCVAKKSIRALSAATTTSPPSAIHVVMYFRAGGKNGPSGSSRRISPAMVSSGTMAHSSIPIPPCVPGIYSPSSQQNTRQVTVQRCMYYSYQRAGEDSQQNNQRDEREEYGDLAPRQAREFRPFGRNFAEQDALQSPEEHGGRHQNTEEHAKRGPQIDAQRSQHDLHLRREMRQSRQTQRGEHGKGEHGTIEGQHRPDT